MRIAVGVSAVVAVIGLWSPGAARADSFIPLPNGFKQGPGVRISSIHEHAIVSPSMAANGAGRAAWVSGDVTVDVDTPNGVVGPNNGAQNNAGTDDSSTHGASSLIVGYLVGCQVALGSFGPSFGLTLAQSPTAVLGMSIPISPGQVKWYQIDNKDMTKSGRYYMNYQDVTMDVQGCGGYAQARQFDVVEIVGPDYHKVTLYGQPFTLG